MPKGVKGFEPGNDAGGRKDGSVGKFTGSVKETILEVFEELGGKQGLLTWVKETKSNKRMFYSAFMKMLPREVFVSNGDTPDSLPFRVLIEGEKEDGSDTTSA